MNKLKEGLLLSSTVVFSHCFGSASASFAVVGLRLQNGVTVVWFPWLSFLSSIVPNAPQRLGEIVLDGFILTVSRTPVMHFWESSVPNSL